VVVKLFLVGIINCRATYNLYKNAYFVSLGDN
jgi:hypothetical protein